ncbi:MAG: pantoate--beta-alanine ligase [Methylophilaceae bacterium]|nr:MAG: pantoate--beta-alanine ligase [Methylophilaceae bacterium]
MQLIHSSAELKGVLSKRKRVAFVPTMGNLHAGHLQLVEIAKQHADCVVVSIFVNPLQFGPNEDLDKYPRTLAADCEKLEAIGANVVFAPSVSEMYPGFNGKSLNQNVTINLPAIASELCGASRSVHFSGVATIVSKLFNIVQPNVAVFGKKDFQQLFIIRKLVNQLNFPIEIIAGDTVREQDGLALSSRNGKFNPAEKLQAAQLHLTLREVVEAIKLKQKDFITIEADAAQRLSEKGWQVDYISIRSSATLQPASKNDGNLVILGAATLNETRLIDNIEFCAKPLN